MYIIYSVYSIVHSVWNNIYTLLQTFLENFSNKKLYKEWKPQRKWQKHCKILCIYVYMYSSTIHDQKCIQSIGEPCLILRLTTKWGLLVKTSVLSISGSPSSADSDKLDSVFILYGGG